MQNIKAFIQKQITWFIAIILLLSLLSFFRIGKIQDEEILNSLAEQKIVLVELQKKLESTKGDNVISLVNNLVVKNDKLDSLINVIAVENKEITSLSKEIKTLTANIKKIETEINKEK